MKPGMKERINDITFRIFNSSDLEKSLREIFDFLQQLVPVDLINLPITAPSKGVLRYMSIVTEDRTMLIDETVKLSDAGRKYIESLRPGKIIIWNDSRENELMQEVSAHMDVRDVSSTMVLTTEVGMDKFGALGLVAWGPGRYSEAHHREFMSIYEPVAAVTRHILSQLEIRSLNELLIIENKELKKRLGYLSSNRIVGKNTGLHSAMMQVDQVAPPEQPCASDRRNRRGQGSAGQCPASAFQPGGRPPGQPQLRRHSGNPVGQRTVRPRKRGFYRRQQFEAGLF